MKYISTQLLTLLLTITLANGSNDTQSTNLDSMSSDVLLEYYYNSEIIGINYGHFMVLHKEGDVSITPLPEAAYQFLSLLKKIAPAPIHLGHRYPGNTRLTTGPNSNTLLMFSGSRSRPNPSNNDIFTTIAIAIEPNSVVEVNHANYDSTPSCTLVKGSFSLIRIKTVDNDKLASFYVNTPSLGNSGINVDGTDPQFFCIDNICIEPDVSEVHSTIVNKFDDDYQTHILKFTLPEVI